MNAETLKRLQELGAFILANGCNKPGLRQAAELIREARGYRWVGIYKVDKKEFVALSWTGKEPVTYPRFPISQGLCGAVLESHKAIILGDVRKDPRCLPVFHTTRSEMVVPMIDDHKKIVGMLDAESDKIDAFTNDDRIFLERAGSLIAHCLH